MVKGIIWIRDKVMAKGIIKGKVTVRSIIKVRGKVMAKGIIRVRG